MSIKIMFSLPVHERADIVMRQIMNLRKYCPSASVCLHVSPLYSEDIGAFDALTALGWIVVNPYRLPIERGQGLFHIHVANYLHAKEAIPEFDMVALVSSNELLIRYGLEAHMKQHVAGAQLEPFDPNGGWHVFRRKIEELPVVNQFIQYLGLPHIWGGQAEGQFYERAVFEEMARIFVKFFPFEPVGFETEEILPQTMAVALVQADCERKFALPFTFQNYTNFVEVNNALVDLIRGGSGFIFSGRSNEDLRSPHLSNFDLSSIFSVKRIPREVCAIRSYIEQLDTI